MSNHLQRARSLFDAGLLAEAEKHARRAVAERPDGAEAQMVHGAILFELKRMKEGETALRRSLALQPDFALAHYNLANVLHQLERFDEAARHYARAASLDPEPWLRQRIASSLGGMLLSLGKFADGWAAYDEWHQGGTVFPGGRHARRLWAGEDLGGSSILLWPEQGLGDQIQFARYAPILAARGARVTVACDPLLRPVLATLPQCEVVAGPPQREDFDFWAPLLRVPRYLGTDLSSIPASVPYLRAGAWKGRLPDGFKVGVSWKGSLEHRNDHHRSLAGIETLRPLWNAPGVSFVSLQKGRDEIVDPPAGQAILQPGREIRDFADLAAIIAQLDLVISVDTATVHLAGALNRPCWVLLPRFATDWRWLRDRDESPWYPSLRLFRQGENYDWAGPIAAAAAALRSLSACRPAAAG